MGTKSNIGRGVAAVVALAGSFGLTASIAAADDCGYTPPSIKQVAHDAVTKQAPREIPGQKAEGYWQQRWSRDVPEVSEKSHQEVRYSKTIKGQPEVSHLEYQFSRENPGQAREVETTYKHKRLNPGQKETFTEYFKYKKVIPAEDGVKEYKFKKSVDDFKTEYQYQKKVRGVVQKKDPYKGWVNVGTFGWEWYSSPSYQWSTDNVDVLQSGDHNSVQSEWTDGGTKYRKVTQAFAYMKNGNTREIKVGSHWEYQWATESPGSGWTKTGESRWKVEPKPAQTVLYKDGAWTTDKPGSPWIETDSKMVSNNDAVAPFWEYKTENGVTTKESEADWLPKASYEGWTKYDSRERETKPYIAPFIEYKTDGGVTTDASKADWFKQASFEGWSRYGEPKKVVTQEASLDVTYWLVYKDGMFSKTTDVNQASWVDTKVKVKDFWKRYGEERTVIDREFVPGYTEYYVPGGEPTRELGESNWTTDKPEGWDFVDKAFHETKAAVPPKTVYDTVVVKNAWVEVVTIPASYTECNDRGAGADTGGNDPAGTVTTQADYTGAAVGGNVLGLGLGLAALYVARRRKAAA